MKNYTWKILSILLLIYAVIAGFLIDVPDLKILGESIRNIFYHVGMWFAMMAAMIYSFSGSISFLSNGKIHNDIKAVQGVYVGILFGLLGIFTGMIWAKYTWGQAWAKDPHLNGAAISLLMYLAYLLLRSSIADEVKRAKVAAVYNIFAFVMMVVLIGVLPRLSKQDGLHPGTGSNDGNPVADLDAKMRFVFYPALIGWMLLSVWIVNLKVRIEKIKLYLKEKELEF